MKTCFAVRVYFPCLMDKQSYGKLALQCFISSAYWTNKATESELCSLFPYNTEQENRTKACFAVRVHFLCILDKKRPNSCFALFISSAYWTNKPIKSVLCSVLFPLHNGQTKRPKACFVVFITSAYWTNKATESVLCSVYFLYLMDKQANENVLCSSCLFPLHNEQTKRPKSCLLCLFPLLIGHTKRTKSCFAFFISSAYWTNKATESMLCSVYSLCILDKQSDRKCAL